LLWVLGGQGAARFNPRMAKTLATSRTKAAASKAAKAPAKAKAASKPKKAAARPKASAALSLAQPKEGSRSVEALNVLQPGKTYRMDAAKYLAACQTLMSLLPSDGAGLTQAEMVAGMRAALPKAQFPGSTGGWWTKAAQLDLEARGIIVRDGGKPLRWRKTQ